MANTINTTYAGDALDQFLRLAIVGNQTVDGGHIYVKDGVTGKYVIPKLSVANIIKSRVATPSSANAGDVTISEAVLAPSDFMVYAEFNPRDLEGFWRPFQPTGALVFRSLPQKVQLAIAEEILKVVANYMGGAVWKGAKTGGTAPYDRFDGIITKAAANANVTKIATPVALTAVNVISKMDTVYKAIPLAVRSNPKCKLFMSQGTMDLYQEALIALTNKGTDPTTLNVARYKNLPIVALADFPADTIFAAVGDASQESNIWLGVDYERDDETLVVDRLQANSELFFFKMLMKADTQIVNPSECVLYKV